MKRFKSAGQAQRFLSAASTFPPSTTEPHGPGLSSFGPRSRVPRLPRRAGSIPPFAIFGRQVDGAMWCWFVDVEFASGALGHLDLTVAVRMDWHEGFQIYGEHGSVTGRTYNPWYYKSSDVDIFREADGASHRVLGADGHF